MKIDQGTQVNLSRESTAGYTLRRTALTLVAALTSAVVGCNSTTRASEGDGRTLEGERRVDKQQQTKS